VNRFEYSSAAGIAAVFAKAASAHFNVVYFQVRGQGDAYYRSALEPCAVALCGSPRQRRAAVRPRSRWPSPRGGATGSRCTRG
jgi:hypothetical protein